MNKKVRVFASVALCAVLALAYAALPVLSFAQEETPDDDIILAGRCCLTGDQCSVGYKCCFPPAGEADCSEKKPNYCRKKCTSDPEPAAFE